MNGRISSLMASTSISGDDMETREIADLLQQKLISNGFIVQRYNAYSTDSIYLKLDYGACNSIRIAGHQGKKHLKYRYNIGSYIKQAGYKRDKYDRFFYPADCVEMLLKQIVSDRSTKIGRYGESRYWAMMEKNKKDNEDSKGFWQKAYTVR